MSDSDSTSPTPYAAGLTEDTYPYLLAAGWVNHGHGWWALRGFNGSVAVSTEVARTVATLRAENERLRAVVKSLLGAFETLRMRANSCDAAEAMLAEMSVSAVKLMTPEELDQLAKATDSVCLGTEEPK